MSEGYQLVNYSPAGDTPKKFYFNECGTFELNGDEGTAVYAWPPPYFHNSQPRPDPRTKSYHDHLEFQEWSTMIIQGEANDEGWIYKAQNENFWFYFSSIPRTISGFAAPVFRLYYSSDSKHFLRWRTNTGTSQLDLHKIPVPGNTGPGGTTNPGGGTGTGGGGGGGSNNKMRFSLGKHKILPNDSRPCPNPPHKTHFVDTRDRWAKAWVDVTYPNVSTIKRDVQDCLKTSAVAAAAAAIVAGYASGGSAAASAAIATFKPAFKLCIETKVGQSVSFDIDYKTEYGDWSGH